MRAMAKDSKDRQGLDGIESLEQRQNVGSGTIPQPFAGQRSNWLHLNGNTLSKDEVDTVPAPAIGKMGIQPYPVSEHSMTLMIADPSRLDLLRSLAAEAATKWLSELERQTANRRSKSGVSGVKPSMT